MRKMILRIRARSLHKYGWTTWKNIRPEGAKQPERSHVSDRPSAVN
jgi:hypothetical protein